MKELQDIVFSQGFGTRYDCQKMIEDGAFLIDGVVHDNPEELLDPQGLVLHWRDQAWPVVEHVLIAMNKPAGYECSMKPGFNPSVMSLLPAPLRKRNVQPVGRLDVDTTGLLLFTDDGALLHRLTHPKRHVDKVYEVTCKHAITPALCEQLKSGVMLADEKQMIAAKEAVVIDEHTLHLTLTQGKYHQVKRMIAACSNRVEGLHRIQVGKYQLPANLKPNEWVWISKEDVL